MQTNKKHSVSGQELDNLLKQAFLNLDLTNPKNNAIMETVAHTTLSQAAAPVTGSGTSFFSLKAILSGIGLLTLISLAAYFLLSNDSDTKKTKPVQYSFDSKISPAEDEEKAAALPEAVANPLPESHSLPKTPQPVHIIAAETEPAPFSPYEKPLPATDPAEPKTKSRDSSYVFPVLTEEEVAANDKRKEKMLIQSIKLSASKYAFIPQAYIKSRYFFSKGVFVGQYMQTTEVSNIEYKTFLFDLLMRNDKAGFLKAKPDQSLWNTIYDQKLGKYFEDVYFSDKAYNDYPVVNVSREGAELYCKWLKEESEYLANEKDLLKEEELQMLFNRSYGLPSANDWAYASEAGKLENNYPWNGPYMRNSKGAYLANFCIAKEKETPGSAAASRHYTSAGVGLGPGQEMLSCRVDAFKPNAFRLYNMSGNVSELVLDDSTGQLLAKGGSWNSPAEELKISSRETVNGNGASPYHGFRPVINLHYFTTGFSYRQSDSLIFNAEYKSGELSPVYLSRAIPSVVYKDTFFAFPRFSGKEISQGMEVKERLIKDLLALRKDKYALIPMGSCSYQSEMVSTYAFYMQTTEVSNAEYKAFLIDLYLKGKVEEFRKCMPDQKQWTNKFQEGFTDPMKQLYFAHEAYNNYPVVNVSRYGAEAYCKWLSTELSRRVLPSDKNGLYDIRLPSDVEWAMAASSKHNRVKYASGSDSLMHKGRYLANYSCVGYATAHYDSLNDFYRVKVTKGGPGFISDEAFFTGQVSTYAPNLYGIYNLAGNVSEMVYLWDTATNKAKGFGTKGGNWVSPDYFLEIDATQEFRHPEKPSPFVGFRPVMTAVTVGKPKP